MKRTVNFFIIMIFFSSCSHELYPGQSTEDRKDVPYYYSYFTEMPVVDSVGDVKYILDKSNNAFILFKGSADSVLLEMKNWLRPDTTSEPTVVKHTVIDIAPFTLFTKGQLKKMSKVDQQRVIELGKYKTLSIKQPKYIYIDDLTPEEKALVKEMDKPKIKISSAVNSIGNTNTVSDQSQSNDTKVRRKKTKPTTDKRGAGEILKQ